MFFFASNLLSFSQELPFRNYLELNGLPSPVVRCIYQDSKGYLWMGTDNGLSRFDGVAFKTFKKKDGLPDNKINAIMEDRRGKLWIGTRSGVSCFFNERLMNYTSRYNLDGINIYSITADEEGILWFGISKGFGCFDGKIFRHFARINGLASYHVLAIVAEKRGNFWLGTNRGLYFCKKRDFNYFSRVDRLGQNIVSSLMKDSAGILWIGTPKGLKCLREGEFISYTKKEVLIHEVVNSIMEDSKGNTWIGTWDGVTLFSRGKITNYSTQNGLLNNFIYSITEDREGNIWFGTHSGASCLISSDIKSYTKKSGLPNDMVIDIIQDRKGRYWFGTSEGLSCYSRGIFKNYSTKDGLINNAINVLLEDCDGKIWIGTPQGLSIFSSGRFTNYTEKNGLPDNILFDLLECRDGTIWIGSRIGLTCCKNGKFSAPPFQMEQIGVYSIIETTRGGLWFSSRNTLYNYSNNRLISISNRYGIPDDDINIIFGDSKGKIWIAAEGGLGCYNGRTFTHYSTKNSTLLDNSCLCILEDHEGNLWIGHPKGITCFNGSEFRTYTSERLGMPGKAWWTGIKDNRGSLWFGTTEGVVNFYPPPVSLNTTPPPVYFVGLKVMEKEIPLTGTNSFASDRNIFRFNFAGLSYGDPTAVSYKYRLEDIDKDWQTTKERSLFYPFLPPGSYSLKVKAINADGFESVTPAEYRFKILPPFWHTWWFLVFLGLLLGGFLMLVLQWRVRRAREKAELKTKQTELDARNRQLVISQRMELMGFLAAGTVHDLKNLLSVIIGYSRLMSQKYQGDNEDHQNIEVIKDTAATAVQMAKQILSFARHKDYAHGPVELGSVLIEILDTLKIIQPKNIHVLRDIQAEPVFFPIHPARFQQVVMNLCLNAFHAMPEGGQLRVALASAADVNNEITLEISDTGNTGIKPEHLDKIFEPFFTTKEQGQGSGLGLFVVKQIVEEYQGKIEVHSEPGQGTSFVIRFFRGQESSRQDMKTQRDFND
jgi:ligand-binding sensor domain-containing protein/signal transduction histidine kinase